MEAPQRVAEKKRFPIGSLVYAKYFSYVPLGASLPSLRRRWTPWVGVTLSNPTTDDEVLCLFTDPTTGAPKVKRVAGLIVEAIDPEACHG